MMCDYDNDGKRDCVLKVRVTSHDAKIIKDKAAIQGVSVSYLLGAVGLKQKIPKSVNDRLEISGKIGAIESALHAILEQTIYKDDSLLVWKTLSKISTQIEHLNKILTR